MADWAAVSVEVLRLLKGEIFEAADVSAMLDKDAVEFRYMPLQSLQSYVAGESVQLEFVTPPIYKDLNNDLIVTDGDYTTIVPTDTDYINGRLTFATDTTNGVKVTGFSADPYMAAARLLEARAAELVEDLQSFSTQNGSFTYSAKSKSLQTMADNYRGMARIIGDPTGLQRIDVHVF